MCILNITEKPNVFVGFNHIFKVRWFSGDPSGPPNVKARGGGGGGGGSFQYKKMSSCQYRDPHVKDHTVRRIFSVGLYV